MDTLIQLTAARPLLIKATVFLTWIFTVLAITSRSTAQVSPESRLTLEELGDTPEVVSSKLPSEIFNAPIGSFVFDQSDISSLPVDSIAEMLRYAPGVHIIRPSNGIWGVGMRGINSRFFNRVEFNVDEQNVYSSIFAGLFGNQHDLLLDDVASVEVVYGPAGGTWGNNAVNGIINVLMKTAFETEGGLLRSHIGTESRELASRVGWAIDDSTSARVYVKGATRDKSVTRFDYSNQWDTARGGFRVDKRTSSKDLISISGEAFYSHLGYAYDLADFSNGDLSFQADAELLRGVSGQAKWTRNRSNGNAHSARGWITYSDLDAPYAAFGMATAGAEARSRNRIGDSRFLSFNAGFAYDQEHTRSTLTSDWTDRFLSNLAAFAGFQDEFEILPEKLSASWGLDFRYEDKSDITTTSPNARLIYELGDTDRIWTSYSQANRTTPVSLSVIESLRSGKSIVPPINISTPIGPFSLDRDLSNAVSNRELDKETLDAFEVGYRTVFDGNRGSLDINGFYYRYADIFARKGVSATPELFVARPFLNVQGTYDNALDGEALGFEAAFSWRLSERIEVSASYSRLSDSFDPIVKTDDPFVRNSLQFSVNEFDHSTPDDMASINLSTDFSNNWNLNTGLRYSESYDFAKGFQPSIFQMDSRLSFKPSENLQISIVGRNLLDSKIQEARLKDFFGHWTEMKREVYLEVKAEF